MSRSGSFDLPPVTGSTADPAAESDQCPYSLYHAKWPGPGQPPIHRRGRTRQRKGEHPPGRTLFKRIEEKHERYCARAKSVSIHHLLDAVICLSPSYSKSFCLYRPLGADTLL